MGDTSGMIEGMAQEKGQPSPAKHGEDEAGYGPPDANAVSNPATWEQVLAAAANVPYAPQPFLPLNEERSSDFYIDMARALTSSMFPRGYPDKRRLWPTNPQPSGPVSSTGTRERELEERTSGEFAAADITSGEFAAGDIITVASILGFSEPTAGQASVLADELADLRKRMLSKLEWESLAGPIVEAGEILRLTGWTRQSLSKAVQQHRVLRLIGSNGRTAYPRDLFTGSPARPLEGIKPVLEAWKDADGWSALSWLVSENADLESRTPREVLKNGNNDDREKVAALAAEAAGRMMQ